MKRLIIIVVGVLFCISAQAQKAETLTDSDIFTKKIDGVWHTWRKGKGNKPKIRPLDGTFIIVSQEEKRTTTFVKGLTEGRQLTHNYDGELIEERHFSDGRLTHYLHYSSGKLDTDANYNSDGQLDGPYTEYYETGELMSKGLYSNGVAVGYYTVFFPDGKTKSITPMKNGEPDGMVRTWDSEGRLVSQTPITKGEINGIKLQYYNSNGTMMLNVDNYDMGRIIGNKLTYYVVGDTETLAYRACYDGDKITLAESYDTNGLITTRGIYTNGLLSMWESYTNGKLAATIEYLNDKPHGRFVAYYSNGAVWKEGTFTNGEVTNETEYDRDGKILGQTQ